MRLQPHVGYVLIWLPILCASCCCSGTSIAVKLAVNAAGMTVDHGGVNQYQRELIGHTPATADEALGERLDVLRDVENRNRMWLLYPERSDPPHRRCFVVEVHGNKIVALTRAEEGGSAVNIPRELVLQEGVKGKPPADCERLLGMGQPLLAVRSQATGQLAQLYDARSIKEFDKQYYCLLRYDERGRCERLGFMPVDGATKRQSR